MAVLRREVPNRALERLGEQSKAQGSTIHAYWVSALLNSQLPARASSAFREVLRGSGDKVKELAFAVRS